MSLPFCRRCVAATGVGLIVAMVPMLVAAQVPTRNQIDQSAEIVLPEDPATVVAVVGSSPILLGELKPKVDARIAEVLSKTDQEVPEDQLRFVRLQMTRGLLSQAIQNRVMRECFLLDQVGTQAADKRREADATMQSKARQMFFESELPDLMKKYEVTTAPEVDAKLREIGSSLPLKQNEFIDAMLGHLYIRSKVNKDPPVSLSEIVLHYQAHRDDFSRKARARWIQLTVLMANHPNRDAAYDVIWQMGREAYYGNMRAVARDRSEDPFADTGGLHHWTNKGSLASSVLEEQIFSIELDSMSQIIEDSDAFYIVRVLEREDAGVRPLADVQDEIRTLIQKRKVEESQEKVLEEIRQRVPVWSLYPEDMPGAKALSIPDPQIATRPAANVGPAPR